MAEKCNDAANTMAVATATITPTTPSTDDVAIALTTLATAAHVDDQTSNAGVVDNNANTSGVNKPKARRGKVKMEKMEKENNLLVTFSKRKAGLIKKANELCTMCGVQCALVVFSPANKVFSFGHPSVDQVATRYLSGTPNPIFPSQDEVGIQIIPQGITQSFQHADAANTKDLIAELRELEAAFEAAKKHGKEMDERRVARMASCWWERPLQELNVHQVETLQRALVDLKSKVFDMAKVRFMPLVPNSSSRVTPSLGLGPSYPDFYGAGGASSFLSFGGFSRWSYNHGPNYEAGPSTGNAYGGWGASSVGSFGGSKGGGGPGTS